MAVEQLADRGSAPAFPAGPRRRNPCGTRPTGSLAEVERLISEPEIPVERRVMYALKAIAGLRHGEAAGLRWRHYDLALEPLGRLLVATSCDTRRSSVASVLTDRDMMSTPSSLTNDGWELVSFAPASTEAGASGARRVTAYTFCLKRTALTAATP